MLANLRRLTLHRGVIGGEYHFLALGAVVWGLHALKKANEQQTGLLWKGVIDPGEDLIVTYRPATHRRARRR